MWNNYISPSQNSSVVFMACDRFKIIHKGYDMNASPAAPFLIASSVTTLPLCTSDELNIPPLVVITDVISVSVHQLTV